MSIPDFQSVMLPILKILGDGQDHVMREIQTAIEDQFHLTEQERQEMLPSGQGTVIANRVGWAKTHMKNAGLLEQPKRANRTDSPKRARKCWPTIPPRLI